ncbi:MAG: GNAT family N-acetyltransferase [Ruminococcaceae bacterium]|nr:GNAT family N-acetyltransferase [Oscillospiraceae bacterium]
MSELYELYLRNFPDTVRSEKTVRQLLADPENRVIGRYENGKLIGAAAVHKNCIRMLCVDAEWRGRGIGSELLLEAEAAAVGERIVIGAGDGYITPGVPSDGPVCGGNLQGAAAFFAKRGYAHDWGCECFDMKMALADFSAKPEASAICYRFARAADLPAIHVCTEDAHPSFTKYYTADKFDSENQRILVAEDAGEIVGTLIVSFGTEGAGIGSVGCTSVKHSHRGRHIGVNLTIHGTKALHDGGMKTAFLGYTYSGLDVMYGYAGYKICQYYMMASKENKK